LASYGLWHGIAGQRGQLLRDARLRDWLRRCHKVVFEPLRKVEAESFRIGLPCGNRLRRFGGAKPVDLFASLLPQPAPHQLDGFDCAKQHDVRPDAFQGVLEAALCGAV
jgi:hypothetical protein